MTWPKTKFSSQKWDIWLLPWLPSRKGINNILKAKQILLLIYLGFDKLYNAFQGSQVLAEGRLWGEVSWKRSRDTQEWGIFSQVTKEDVISFNWSCLCRTNIALDTAGEGEGSSFRKEIHCFQMRYSAKNFIFFFSWGRREDFLQWLRALPGILSNPAITLFILDSSYFSKLVTLISICLSPTHYFWCLQSPLFNIFGVFS